MPRLKNIKHEHFSRQYVNKKGNQKKAYMEVYPASSEISAESNSSRLISKDKVRDRIYELLEQNTGSQLSILVSDLINLKSAQKSIIVDKVIEYVNDNPTQLEAVKTLMKLHGLLTPQQSTVDARSVTFNISAGDIKSLGGIMDRLERIEDRQDKISGKISGSETKSGMGGMA